MTRSLVIAVLISLCACSPQRSSPPYTEDDVRAFVQPGTSREAIIAKFGQPLRDDKNPKFEGGYTGVDEIMFYVLLPQYHQRGRVFAGFQVRLKDGKAVEWMSTHWD